MKSFITFSLAVVMMCGTAHPQDRGTIQCETGLNHIVAWTAPGSAWAVDHLSCGQEVSIRGLDKGYYKIQLGIGVGYVYAKYIKLSQVQERRPEEPTEMTIPLVQAPPAQKQQLPRPEEQPRKASESPQSVQSPQPPQRSIQEISQESQRSPVEEKILESGIEVGAEIFHVMYEEPGLMEESGVMFGVYGNYVIHPNSFVITLDGRFSVGNVEYSSYQGSDDIRDYIFESRALFGYDFKVSARAYLTPFMGIGYRYLFDGLKEIETSALLTYDRKSNYIYSPIGLECTFGLRNGWSLGASGEYDLFWHGWQFNENFRYHGIDLSDDYKVENNQENGWGTRGSVRIIKNLGKIDFAVEPYFRYWDIDDSDYLYIPEIGDFIHEPPNTSKEWGGRVGVRF